MFPVFNSHPLHSNGAASSSAPQQVIGNPVNFAPQQMQIPPQMGIFNPQATIPFNNSNPQFFPFQAPQNFNNRMSMDQINNVSVPQHMPRFLAQNNLNPSQFLGPNSCLGFPNHQIQSMNQFFPIHGANLNAQAIPGSFNLPQSFTGVMQHPLSSVALNQTPNAIQQLQGFGAFVPIRPHGNINNIRPLSSNSQGTQNPASSHKVNRNGKKPGHNNFSRNSKGEASLSRFTRSQNRNKQNINGNFRHQMQLKKGNVNGEGRKAFDDDCVKQEPVQKKRSIPLMYTEQEIRQWREDRKKNYPSKANIDKKLAKELKEPEVGDEIAKLRRQQLKQILAKQAELGCEVAEIPDCYLSDSEQQVNGRKQKGRPFSRKEKFQNKFNKRGRFNRNSGFFKNNGYINQGSSDTVSQNDHLAKKQHLGIDDSSHNREGSKREPTLLQKLLSADIRRDKRHLLQTLRFMVLNSFFADWPEKPLSFPVVVVKETGGEGELVVEGASKGDSEVMSSKSEDLVDDYKNNKEKPDDQDQAVDFDGRETQEEGEITD